MTAPNETELIFDPNVLYFEPPYNAVKKDVLVIQNTTTNKFVFKIKTTSPKVFCVKPNCGFIGPAGTEFDTVEVALLFNATDVDVNAGKKDKFLVEWIAMLDTDPQSDAKSLWSAIANDRAATQHKINAFIARRPDSDSNASVGRGANSSNGSTAKRRVPSKLASSLTVPDSADADVFGASPSAGAAADTVASVAPAVVAAASTPIVVTPAAVAPASSASSEPAMQFATPKSDDVELRARLSQVTQERDKLAAQLAAAQRALTAASSAAATAAAASATTSGAAKASSAPAVANAAVPAPDQGIAKHMYLIALLMVVFAFLFGRFSVATSKMLWSE